MGELACLALQLGIGIAPPLVAADQRFAIRLALHHAVEEDANGLLDQRRLAGATRLAEGIGSEVLCGHLRGLLDRWGLLRSRTG